MNKMLVITLRLIASLMVIVAVITQLLYGLENNPTFKVSNFFSFFTIESNILAAIIMFISALFLWKQKTSPTLDSFRGAATLYMTITGITYFLLLRGIEDQLQTPIPWVNFVLHYAFPVVMLLDWFLTPLARKISTSQALSWLLFPIAYVLYSMVRGYYTFWYPYPFLNPLTNGPAAVIISIFGIAVVALIGALLLARNRNILKAKHT